MPGRSFISIAFVFLFLSRSSSSLPLCCPVGHKLGGMGCRAGWTVAKWQNLAEKTVFRQYRWSPLLHLSPSLSPSLLRGGSGTNNTCHLFLCGLECSLCAFYAQSFHPLETRVLLGPSLHPAGLLTILYFSSFFFFFYQLYLLSPSLVFCADDVLYCVKSWLLSIGLFAPR